MAKGRIEQEIVVKVLGGKEVVELEKQIKALEKAKAEIVVELDAEKAAEQLEVIDKAIAELKGEKAEIEVEAKVSNALDALDDVAREAKEAEEAAEALSRALGPELTARANVDDLVTDFQRMGLTFDDIAQNADRLGAKLREVGQANTGGLEAAMRRTRGSVDDLGRSAGSSKSVLANMVGNATQDVGALAGVAGSAGVAIGQMGEYMADAAASGDNFGQIVSNFGKVLGPIAGLSIGLALATKLWGDYQKEQAEVAENTGQASDKLREITGVIDELNKALEVQAEVGDFGDKLLVAVAAADEGINEVLASANKLGISFTDLGDILAGLGAKGTLAGTNQIVESMMENLGVTREQAEGLAEAIARSGDEWLPLIEFARLHTDLTVEQIEAMKEQLLLYGRIGQAADDTDLNKVAEDYLTTLETTVEGLKQVQDARDRLARRGIIDASAIEVATELGDAIDDTTEALDRYSGAHERNMFRINQRREAQEAAVEAEKEAAEAYIEWADAAAEANRILVVGADARRRGRRRQANCSTRLFGLTRVASANEAAFDALGETLKENGHTFDINTEKGRANQKVLESLAESLIPQIAANYKNAAGNLQAFTVQMDSLKTGVFQQLRDETDLTDRQIRDIINRLGVFDGSKYAAQFELLGLEDAESKVALLLPLLETLNVSPDIIKQVSLQVLADDPAGALRTIQAGINSAKPPAVPLGVRPPTDRELANASTGVSNTLKRYPARLPVVPFIDVSRSQRAVRAFFEGLDAGGTADGFGAIAGEKGPEILNDRYLTTGPTYVPPGTRVTSRRKTNLILRTRGAGNLRRYDSGGIVPSGPVTVNFNGVGAIGNRYDLMRTVYKANLDKIRLRGARG